MRSLTQMTRRFVAAALVLTALGFVAVPASQPASAYTTIYYRGAGSAASIGLIGDSSFAGVRWLNSYDPLKRYNFVLDAESCRRTTAPSCRGREGYAPANAITTLQRLDGTFDDVLVMVTGYNDPGYTFAQSVDRIMAEAIRQGIGTVVWLTMRTAAVSYVSPGYRSNSGTFADNNRILLQKAHLYNGRLQIADWASYSTPPRGWITADGVHLTRSGTVAVTDFIADQVALVLAGRTITPPFTAPAVCRVGVTLRSGDDINDVRCLEQYLQGRGVFTATPDKVYDATTAAAVDRINALQRWTQDGIADVGVRQTIGAWRPPTARPFCTIGRTLQAGSAGTDVSCLARRLSAHGYHLLDQSNFTRSVHESVVHFQRSVGTAPTGVADPMTLMRLGLWKPSCRVRTALLPGNDTPGVTCLRQFLTGIGRYVPTASSVYDLAVANQVRYIERWRGLPVDGIADVTVLGHLGILDTTAPATAPAPPPPAPAGTTTTTAPPATTAAAAAPSTAAAPTTAAPVAPTTPVVATTDGAATSSEPAAMTTTTTEP